MTDALMVVRDGLHELALAQGIPVERDANGDLYVPMGSTITFAQVAEADGRALLEVWATVGVDVPITPDLYRFVAETSFLFGRLMVEPTGDGAGQVVFGHTLLAEPMNGDVLLQILGVVANTADGIDDEIVGRFGGRRFDGTSA